MPVYTQTIEQWNLVWSKERPLELRIFTACELICKPLSILSILMIPGWVLLQRFGVVVPAWITSVLQPILVSAAIGYLTNWVAIEMLFKPYENTWRHPFAWLSFGYWRQGLVPKNKAQIAATIGEKVSGQLLQPEKLALDLCDMVSGLLENREIILQVQNVIKQQVAANKCQIAEYVGPQMEQAIIGEIDKLLTADNVRGFWDSQIEPWLTSEEVRSKLTERVVATIEAKVPAIAEKIRPSLVQLITDYCKEKSQGILGGMLAPFIGPLADGLADKLLSNQTIENAITSWINSPETPATLSDGLEGMVNSIREYIKSPDRDAEIDVSIQRIRQQFKEYLDAWIQEKLPAVAEKLLGNDGLWNWSSSMFASCKPQFEEFIKEKGMPLILEKLDIQRRIQDAVNSQDMRQFHDMVNDVVSQHLGAIQVLGYLLGAMAGALMTLLA